MSAEGWRKVAFVTGASSGIGRATAELFIARGYAVALVDRDEAQGRRVEAELNGSGECVFLPCDVSDDASVRAAVEATVDRYGRLDAAFNGAGVDGEYAATADYSAAVWDRVLAIDLTGVWHCMRHQIPAMLKSGGGSIVNCASGAGLAGVPMMSAYSAAKHGVVGLTRTAALEYGRQGVRVNAVCPGVIDTPMLHNIADAATAEIYAARCPMGRIGQAREIADAVLWLSEGADFVNGQAIAIDGGTTAG